MEARLIMVRRILDRLVDENGGSPRHSGKGRFWNLTRDEFVNGPIYGLKPITPGEPDKSWLVAILKGPVDTPSGRFARMPAGGPYISDDDLAFIIQWIKDGAPGMDQQFQKEYMI